jgi:hypothetical protein
MTKIIYYYDTVKGLWSETQTATSVPVPDLDGHLYFDEFSRQAASTDWGKAVRNLPSAVLQPGSINDILKVVKFCKLNRIKVGVRGQAHTMYGQSQVAHGLVIAMSWLKQMYMLERGDKYSHILVDAGLTWQELLIVTVKFGLSPPVLPDYLLLSVGGTLSVGGVNGTSYRYGAQVDNILELDVVTGEGDLINCSPLRNPDLFEAALGGLGQCAIIVRAKIRLISAPIRARVFDMPYTDLESLLADFRTLLADERFSSVEGLVQVLSQGNFTNVLEGVCFYDTEPPDKDALLRGLHCISKSVTMSDISYLEFCDRVTSIEAKKRAEGRWDLPHPGFNMFIPDQHAHDYIDGILNQLTYDDTVDFPAFIYGFRKNRLTRRFLRTPDTDIFFLFTALRTVDPKKVLQAVDQNRGFYNDGYSKGGRIYPISAVPLSEDDWKGHFEPYTEKLQQTKSRYDPDGILTPGPGIFGRQN